MPFPQPPAAAPARSWASAPAPVRTIDPPLHPEPVTRPAPPRPAKAAAAPAAAAAAPAAPATVTPPAPGRRGDVLPSVTVIDRIPIPEPGPEARDRARLARARPAGFWVRFVALLVDSSLIAVAGVGVSMASLVLPGSAAIKIPVIYGFVTGLSLAYLLVFWAIRGATPGKMVMGLAVVAADTKIGSGIGWGPAILRALGYVASSVIFGIGFLLVAFTSQKQGLHDLIAGTRVLRLR
jgi:uncharacterized RDD family membrane protein YckC